MKTTLGRSPADAAGGVPHAASRRRPARKTLGFTGDLTPDGYFCFADQDPLITSTVRSTRTRPPSGPTNPLSGMALYPPPATARSVGRYPPVPQASWIRQVWSDRLRARIWMP